MKLGEQTFYFKKNRYTGEMAGLQEENIAAQ
jgi:hypothetical protein